MKSIRTATVIVAAVLGAIGLANGQTVPYESAQRSRIGSGPGQDELPPGGLFEPRVDSALQYVANIELVPDGEPQIDMVGLEVAPGFYASYSTGAVVAAMDYSLIARFWEEGDFDDVSHLLGANGQWLAVPEWLSIRGQASYADSVIDPRRGLNYGGLGIFQPANLEEVATAAVNPVVQHRFGDVEFGADYAYGRTWFLDEGKGQPVVGFVSNEDSTDQSASASIGSARDASRSWARAFYQWNRSDYDTALPFQYEVAALEAGVWLSRTLTLVGDVGRESDLVDNTTEGGLDADVWSAGLRWEPSDRSFVEARYGERFFGESYSFSAEHRARWLEFTASYSEQPTVETRRLSLGQFDPGQLPPPAPDVDFGRLTASPYVAKDARATVAAVGSRTRIGLSAFSLERDFLNRLSEGEIDTGVMFSATRQLASNLSTDFVAAYSEIEWQTVTVGPNASGTTRDYDTQVSLRLNRESGVHLTIGAEAGYLTRSGFNEYDGWWVALRARWTP